MNPEIKKKINEKYERKLQHGEFFWPDSIFKDAIMALGLFILLVSMATFLGVDNVPKADPSDTAYVPRPEWYFLFLFKFLALYGQIPVIGKIEWLATVLIPGIAIAALVLLPFIEKSPSRYYTKRMLPLTIMAIVVLNMVLLTLMADIPTVSADGSSLLGTMQTFAGLIIPGISMLALFVMGYRLSNNQVRIMGWTTGIAGVLMITLTITVLALAPAKEKTEESVATTLVDQIVAGQDLYSLNCVECHGDDGKVTTIEGVEGLEGKQIMAISSKDVLYTLNDASLAEVIAYGRPEAGMNPFGKAFNAEGLTKSQIDYIVTFMRYSWDDRFEKPAIKPLFPALADGEVPSYAVHIEPIVKRYCVSCHRSGKDNNDFWMTSYDEILKTGDNAPNVTAGDANSILLRVIQGETIADGASGEIGSMPPNHQLGKDIVDVFVRWVMGGMPQTAEDAAAVSVTPTPAP